MHGTAMIHLDAIEQGLKGGEFFLEYIPTIAFDDGRCVGAEALVRWRRPSGVVPPQEFIPLTENTYLSGLITYWVIETAAAELGSWLRSHDDIHLGINVPPDILGRGALDHVVSKAGLQSVAWKLVFEVTERGVPDLQGVHALEVAARRGVRIALDDVNVGSGTLVVLSRCNVEIIKLDRGVVAQIVRDDNPPPWVAALTALLRTTALEVIAEGVESAEQLRVLRAAGVKFGQGYYFSRPLPAAEFLAFFQSRR
jgi:EAL domain-containing protein (putative c-di-GMP-specific phosphodiesterase class I)